MNDVLSYHTGSPITLKEVSPLGAEGLLSQAWSECQTFDFTRQMMPSTKSVPFNAAVKEGRRLAMQLHKADKHYLTDDFIRMAQHLAMSPPEVLLRAATLARPRFDLMWIEWNNLVRMRASRPDSMIDFSSITTRLGVLIEPEGEHFRATLFNRTVNTENTAKSQVILWPIGVDFDFTNGLGMGLPGEATLGALGYHYAKHYAPTLGDDDAPYVLRLQRLMAQAPAGPFGAGWGGEMLSDPVRSQVLRRESSGDGRILLAVLALLACNPATITEPLRMKLGGFRDASAPGRYLPRWERKVVSLSRPSLNLPEVVAMLEAVRRGPAGDRRLHKVTGAWHQSRKKGSDRCQHSWVARLDEDGNRIGSDQFICTACKRLRWWMPQHHRGTAFEGIVDKEYEVKAK